MACDVNALQAALQASGLCSETDPVKLLQLTAQAMANHVVAVIPGTDTTPAAILDRACASGIGKVQDPMKLTALVAQLNCNGIVPPVPPDPYNGVLVYTRLGLGTTTVPNPTGVFNLTFGSNPVIEIHCHNCPNITSLTCNNSGSLVLVDLLNCINLKTLVFQSNTALPTINLSSFTSLTTLTVIQNGSLQSINLSNLVTAGTLNLYQNGLLQSISCPALTTVTGEFNITTLNSCTSISFPVLQSVGGSLQFAQAFAATLISFPALQTVGANIAAQECSVATTVNFNSLQSFGGTIFNIHTSPAMTSVSLPAFNTLFKYINAGGDTNLTTFNYNGKNFTTNASIFINNCKLTQAAVDQILATGVASGMTSGSILLNGGTSATPSATGLANKATLIGNGVTVNTN